VAHGRLLVGIRQEAELFEAPLARSPGGARGSRFVLGTVQRLPLHRELNLCRTPDSSDRLGGETHPDPSSGHEATRRNCAAARLRYAAASATALSKCAAVAGVAVVRPGPRRRSSKYAAAVRPVKRRSPAGAGNDGLCTPATERGCDGLRPRGVVGRRRQWPPGVTAGCKHGCGFLGHEALKSSEQRWFTSPAFFLDRIGLFSPRRGCAAPHSSSSEPQHSSVPPMSVLSGSSLLGGR
jgi:hypothetical protein